MSRASCWRSRSLADVMCTAYRCSFSRDRASWRSAFRRSVTSRLMPTTPATEPSSRRSGALATSKYRSSPSCIRACSRKRIARPSSITRRSSSRILAASSPVNRLSSVRPTTSSTVMSNSPAPAELIMR